MVQGLGVRPGGRWACRRVLSHIDPRDIAVFALTFSLSHIDPRDIEVFALTFSLTFSLTFALTFALTFSLTFALTFALTFSLTFSLTLSLTISRTFSLIFALIVSEKVAAVALILRKKVNPKPVALILRKMLATIEMGGGHSEHGHRHSNLFSHIDPRARAPARSSADGMPHCQAEHFARAKKVLAAEVQRLRSQLGENSLAK